MNAIDRVGVGASESLPHLDELFRSMDSGEGGGVRTSAAPSAIAGESTR